MTNQSRSTGCKLALLTAVAVTLTAGTYLRVQGNGEKLFWYDEVFTALWYSGHDLDAAEAQWAGRRMRPADLRSLQQLDANSDYSSVITTIIHDDPQHSPLYFLLLRGWSQWAGDSISRLRDFSALAGILTLPILFWLCIELTGSRRTAWVAVLLVAVSPFHIVYAQEARQYTLLILFVALASALLLWTLRSPRAWKWVAYALTTAAGLYTHLLFCFVPAAHMAFVLGTRFFGARPDERQRNGRVLHFTLAAAAGTLLFTPWAWIIYVHLQTAANRLSWTQADVGLVRLVGMWGYNYSSIFVDANRRLANLTGPGWLDYSALLFQALMLLPGVCAVVWLTRRLRSRTSLFLLPLLLIPFISLALPDLIFGGIRSGGGQRYLAPSLLALEIALACWISAGLDPQKRRGEIVVNPAAGLLLVTFVAAGLLSGSLFNASDIAWHKSIGSADMQLARDINAAEQPLVIADSFARLLTLSQHVDDDTTLIYTTDIGATRPVWNAGPVFVLRGREPATRIILNSSETQLLSSRGSPSAAS